MPGSMATFAAPVVTYLTTYLLHSTLLLGVVWMVLYWLPLRNHGLRERLWKLAALGGLVTAPLQLALDSPSPLVTVLMPEFSPVTEAAPLEAASAGAHDAAMLIGVFDRAPPVGSRLNDSTSGSLRSFNRDPAGSAPRLDSVRSAAQRDAARSATRSDRSATHAFSGVQPGALSDARPVGPRLHENHWVAQIVFARAFWAIGLVAAVIVFGGIVKLTWDTLSFPWRLAGTRTLDGGAAPACLDRLLRRLSIRRSVTLLSSPSQDEPAAFGLWRWRIVLPESAAERLSEDELTALLAHELAHLLRGDAIWLWVGRVLCCCLPFQLLNFLARRQWRRAGEFQCDEWAVRHGAHRLSLARCLTKVAEWRTEQRLCLAALAASGARSSLADRVERLVQARGERDSPVRRLVHELVWLAAAAATATLPWWGPRTALPAPPTRSTDADNSAARQFGSFDRVEPDRHSPPQPEGKPAWAAPGPDADHQQELRRAVAEESWKLKTELTRLERSLSALAETAERTGAEPAVQARLNSMRRRLADLHRLRAVLDRLGSAGAPGGTDSTGDGREWGFRLPEPSLVPEDL